MFDFFSTFTGIGGLEAGLEDLGARCVGYSEIAEGSIRVYDRHHPGRRNFGDITKVEPAFLPDFDLLTGGFPCQSFSLAGYRKGFKDSRGAMIFYLAQILEEKRPAFAVLENVRGIVNHDRGNTFRNVLNLLAQCGYFVRAVVLNAMDHGSAQNRERVFFLCSREDFDSREPERVDPGKRFRHFREAFDGGNGADWVDPDDWILRNTIRRHSGRWPEEANAAGFTYELVGGYDRVGTLLTGIGGGGPNKNHAKIVQENGSFRYLSPVEGERLQGFPDNWTAFESTRERWFALGNAVNCNVSRYLFLHYLRGLWY